jgi:hypothetical protein
MQLHRVESHLHTMRLRMLRNRPIGGKQGELSVPLRAFIEGFDLPTPGLMLAVMDLAELQHLALNDLAAGTAPVLDDIPITMLFAVFDAFVESQEHANQLSQKNSQEKILGLHYRRFRKTRR